MPRRRNSKPEEAESPVPLGAALQSFLRASRLNAPAKRSRLEDTWRRVVGEEIAGHTQVLRLRKGIVEVGVDSSALMNEMQFHRAAVLGDLQREIRAPRITAIAFTLMATQEHDGPRKEF